MAIRSGIVVDSLRPNSACFEGPSQKSKDKCEVEMKLHIGDSRHSLKLQRTHSAFVYASDNSSSRLAFLNSNGFDLQRPEIQGSIYYSISLAKTWKRAYAVFQKENPKYPDFSAEVDATLDWINLGDLQNPDIIQKDFLRQWIVNALIFDFQKRDFFERHLAAPLGPSYDRFMNPSMQERVGMMQDVLLFNQALSGRLSSLMPQHPLYGRSKELSAFVLGFIYWGEPEAKDLFSLIRSFGKDLYQAKDIVMDLPLSEVVGESTMPALVPLVPVGESKTVSDEPYNYFQILADTLESPKDHHLRLRVKGETEARLKMLLQWLRQDIHLLELRGQSPEAPGDEVLDQALLFVVPPPETLPQAFVTPPAGVSAELKSPGNSNTPFWWLITEGALCAGGTAMTLYSLTQSRDQAASKAPLLIGGGTMGAGCGAGLTRLLAPKDWNPYFADSMGGLGAAVLGVGIPLLVQTLAGEEGDRPGDNTNSPPHPPITNPEGRNPTLEWGP